MLIKIFVFGRNRFPLRNFSALSDKKISKKNLDTSPPPLILKLFRCRKFCETQHRRVPLRDFWHCETKQFWQKTRINPSIPSINFFDTGKFPKQKGPLTKFFGPVRQKSFSAKSCCPPPLHESFRYKTFFETQKGSPTKVFGTVRQKSLDRKW